jgi:YesN/AraC family two-component response regulator
LKYSPLLNFIPYIYKWKKKNRQSRTNTSLEVLVMTKEFDEGFAQDTDQCDLLIVDDEPSYRGMLKVYFRLMIPGIKIKLAKDGQEAYDLALTLRPRIIWTCIRMPSINGLELLEFVKRNPDIQNTKFIIYTAYDSDDMKKQAFELGADAFLAKGDFEQLEEGVKIVTKFLE